MEVQLHEFQIAYIGISMCIYFLGFSRGITPA